jgi:Skp family chaperone for outer membrane proteins
MRFMNLRSSSLSTRTAIMVLAAATTLGSLVLVSTVTAQTAGGAGSGGGVVPTPTKVAVVSPNRIFADMQETKDLKVRLQNELTKLQEEGNQKKQKLDDLQRDRSMLRVNTPEFGDKTRELVREQVAFQAWAQVSQAELQRVQKEQTRILYDKIGAMTAQVAAQKGFDVVIADQRVDIPNDLEQVTPEQLRMLLSARNIAYASPSVDITSEVTVQLDVQYKNTPAGAATPTPVTPTSTTPPATPIPAK